MNTKLSSEQIGRRIKALRKSKAMSQEDLARLLKISRPSLAQIELGNRNISVIEFMKLSEVLGFSMDKFLVKEYHVEEEISLAEEELVVKEHIRVSVPCFNAGKFRNVLLYILERCAGKPNVGETVLNKLLYFSDMDYYEKYEEQLTGSGYIKLAYGPVPQELAQVLSSMIEKRQLQRIKTDYHAYPQTRYLPLEKADLTKMTAAEKEVIDRVIDCFSDWSASMISDYSHNDKPWRATEENEMIDYELVFYRRPPYSVRVYDDEE